MSIHVATDVYIAINGTAVSDHANTCTLTDQADQIDATTFGPAGYKSYMPGLKDANVAVDFFSDFGANQINSILQPLYASGGTFALEVRPTSAARSATNPAATMTARLYSYSGIAGGVGAAASFSAAFQNAGTAGLVWATA